MAKKKTWREKVNGFEEKIHVITPEWESKLGKGKILIPKALDIERLINKSASVFMPKILKYFRNSW